MDLHRYGTFAGGIDLPDETQETIGRAIEPFSPTGPAGRAGPLRVPLALCGSTAAEAIVQPGQEVRQDQQIAAAVDSRSVDVFSPIDGRVVAVTSAEVAGGDAFVTCPAIELDGEQGGEQNSFANPQAPARLDWRAASDVTLRERIEQGGLTTHRRPARPLRRWLAQARKKNCHTLIANCVTNQPYVTAEHRLLVERSAEVAAGLAILAKAVSAQDVILAVDRRRTADYHEIVELTSTYHISRVALPHKYPIGADPILVKVLTRREMPPGGSVMDVGVAVTDAATCLAVYMWVVCGVRPTGRVVTVAGPRAGRDGNYWAAFGTNCMSLLGQAVQPVIHNGPMVAIRCSPGAVVGPTTDAVLALESDMPAPAGPCIRCSWCTDHCPARLNVAALNDAFELCDLNMARKLVAQACVECGVCTYVCPARLPLSRRTTQLKRVLTGMDDNLPLFVAGDRTSQALS